MRTQCTIDAHMLYANKQSSAFLKLPTFILSILTLEIVKFSSFSSFQLSDFQFLSLFPFNLKDTF